MVIETEFDSPLLEDVSLEDSESKQSFEDLLKNAENITKSFLYLKALSDMRNPFVNKVTSVNTVESVDDEVFEYSINSETGKIIVKNLSKDEEASVFINGGEFVLFPYENIEVPLSSDDKLELKGRFSVLETEYKI